MKILKPGLLTTVQDLGRPGFQQDGVSVGGAMDPVALRVANLLVGNPEGAAGLEITLLGPTIEFTRDATIAITGARLSPVLEGRAVIEDQLVSVRAGATLSFGEARAGCRAYLAIAGGIDVPAVLGGRGTYLRARLGGLAGRALRAGDVLPVGTPSTHRLRDTARTALPSIADRGAVRVTRGTHFPLFDNASRQALFDQPFRVTPQSDRMGYRLSGPALSLTTPFEPISEPVSIGSVQVPPEGQPILLMADRQTTGGYPRIAHVVTVDLPLIAQKKPGETLMFEEVTLEEAERLYIERERTMTQVQQGLTSAAH